MQRMQTHTITIQDAARLLKVSESHIRNLRDSNQIKVIGTVKKVAGYGNALSINDAQLLDFNDVKKLQKLTYAATDGSDSTAA